jgi:hypothetical protein
MQGERAMGSGQREAGVDLGHGQAPPGQARVARGDGRRTAGVASALAWVDEVAVADGALALALAEVTPARAAAVNRELVGAGLAVSEVREVRRPLREVFLDLTGHRTGGADSVRTRAGRRGSGRMG